MKVKELSNDIYYPSYSDVTDEIKKEVAEMTTTDKIGWIDIWEKLQELNIVAMSLGLERPSLIRLEIVTNYGEELKHLDQ